MRSSYRLLLLVCAVLSIPQFAFANDAFFNTSQTSARDQFGGISIAKLPQHVRAPAGKFTFFIDKADKKSGTRKVYFVNRTQQPVYLPMGDSRFLTKREAKVDGKWMRMQSPPCFQCGNSYQTGTLGPKSYRVSNRVFKDAPGKKHSVRYTFFDLIDCRINRKIKMKLYYSNEVTESLSLKTIEYYKYDSTAMNETKDIRILEAVADGRKKCMGQIQPGEPCVDCRIFAFDNLIRFPLKQSRPIFEKQLKNQRINATLYCEILKIYWVYAPQSARAIYQEQMKNKKSPFRKKLLSGSRLIILLSGKYEFIEFDELSRIVDNPRDPHFPEAVKKFTTYINYGKLQKIVIKKLTKILSDPKTPEKLCKEVKKIKQHFAPKIKLDGT